MNILDTPLPNYHLFLRSSEYTTALNASKSNLMFELNQPIIIHPNMDLLVSLESFNFTNSFYTVNENNRYFFISYNESGSPYTVVTLDTGNYDVDSLVVAMNLKLAAVSEITVTYNPVTMKLTFIHPEISFMFVNPLNNNLNAYEMMGFDDNGSTVFSDTLISPYVVNLMSIQVLHIVVPNLNIASIGLKNKTKYSILANVHIESLAGESQTWKNTSGFKYKLSDSVINFINVLVYDQDMNLVNFNGIDWFLTMSFQPIYKPELRAPQYLENTDRDGLEYEAYLKQEQDRNLMLEIQNYLARKKYSE